MMDLIQFMKCIKGKNAKPDDSNFTEIIAFLNEFAEYSNYHGSTFGYNKKTFDNMHNFKTFR